MKNLRNFLLVDGHNLAYRCFHQPLLAKFKRSDGLRSGVFYGFLATIFKLITRFQPIGLIITFDSRHSGSHHKELIDGYKSTRKKPKKSFLRQMYDLEDFFKALGIRTITVDYTEADELLYHLTLALKGGAKALIISADHDLFQCIDKETFVYDDLHKKMWTVKAVKERYHVGPSKIALWKALCGDKSDNVKGVSGIGPKNAVKLIKKYKYYTDILAQLKGKQQEEFRLAYRVVKFKTDNPLAMKMGKLVRKQLKVDKSKVKDLLELYSCKSILVRLPLWMDMFKNL